MNALGLKGLRISKGKSQLYMSKCIEKSLDSYAKKERGSVFFTPKEMSVVAHELNMTFEQFNDIFLTAHCHMVIINGVISPW